MSSILTELSISIVTLLSAWFIGNKNVWGQRLAMAANVGWWFYIIAFGRWGLVPMEIGFTFIVLRNLIKWEKEAKHG